MGAVDIAVARAALNTSTGNQDITTSDFGGGTPEGVLLWVTRASADGTAADTASLCFGAADGTREWVNSVASQHAAGSSNSHRIGNAASCILLMAGDGTVEAEGVFVSFVTNGVRINLTTAPATGYFIHALLFGGTDLSFACGRTTINAGQNNPTDITTPGFEPDLVLGFYSGVGSESLAAHDVLVIGAASWDGATIVQKSASRGGRDNQGTMDERARLGTAEIVDAQAFGSMITVHDLTASAFDSSGFSITCTSTVTSQRFPWIAIAVTGRAVWVGEIDSPTATGAAANTSPGFEPQLVLLVPTLLTSADASATDATAGSIGFCALTDTAQFSVAYSAEDAAADSNTQTLSDNQAMNLPLHDGAAGFSGTLTSFDANGFTINYSAVPGTTRKWFGVAIEAAAAVGGSIAPHAMHYQRMRAA